MLVFNMKRIFTNSIIFVGCEILSKSVPFLLLPYLTRVLSPEDFGAVGLFTSLQAFFIICVSLSFDGAIARYYYRYGKRNFDSLINHSLCLIIALTFFTLLILLFSPWDNFLTKYALITAALQAFFNVILTSKQCQKKATQYAFYQISFAIISAVTTVAFFKVWSYSVDERIKSIAFSLTVMIIIFLFSNLRKKRKSFHIKTFNLNFFYFISFGAPLIIHQMSLYVKGQFDRVLIAHTFTLSDLAIYTAAFQFASCLNVVIMALNKALLPYYFESCKNGYFDHERVKNWFLKSIPLMMLPAVIMYFIPDSLFTFILGDKYSGVNHLATLFVLGFCMQIPYLLAVNFMFYHNDNKKVAFITFTSSIVHLISLFILKSFGVAYLPFALITSNTICLILLFFVGMSKHAK